MDRLGSFLLDVSGRPQRVLPALDNGIAPLLGTGANTLVFIGEDWLFPLIRKGDLVTVNTNAI